MSADEVNALKTKLNLENEDLLLFVADKKNVVKTSLGALRCKLARDLGLIKENDYNLNIPRYVDTFEEEELIDIDEVKQNIANIEAELAEVQAQMKKYIEELGL